MKPWDHHTDTVVAAALAMKGRARVPAAPRPREPQITVRLLRLLITLSSLVCGISPNSPWSVVSPRPGQAAGGVLHVLTGRRRAPSPLSRSGKINRSARLALRPAENN